MAREAANMAATFLSVGAAQFFGWAVTMVPFIGGVYALVDCLLIFRASHKCLHDNIADTIVVKA